jgi:allophanate hydrolase subunit 2
MGFNMSEKFHIIGSVNGRTIYSDDPTDAERAKRERQSEADYLAEVAKIPDAETRARLTIPNPFTEAWRRDDEQNYWHGFGWRIRKDQNRHGK